MVVEEGRKKRRRERNLARALWLRPIDVFDEYGIPPSTLCILCKHSDPTRRIPSLLIPGRSGRRGLRLVKRTELDAYLAKFPGLS